MLYSEKKSAHTLLCFIDQTPDEYLVQLWIFINHAHPLYHNNDTKEAVCVIPFQFHHVHFSIYYRIQTVIAIQRKSNQTLACSQNM